MNVSVGPELNAESDASSGGASVETSPRESEQDSKGSTQLKTRPRPSRPRLDRMPPWKLLLHNDDKNDMGFVIETIIELTSLNPHAALIKMVEAHKSGVALLLTVHREYAELLHEQFTSKGLTTTIEPDC